MDAVHEKAAPVALPPAAIAREADPAPQRCRVRGARPAVTHRAVSQHIVHLELMLTMKGRDGRKLGRGALPPAQPRPGG